MLPDENFVSQPNGANSSFCKATGLYFLQSDCSFRDWLGCLRLTTSPTFYNDKPTVMSPCRFNGMQISRLQGFWWVEFLIPDMSFCILPLKPLKLCFDKTVAIAFIFAD